MNALNLEATQDTPQITLDKGSGKFEVSGRSLPEDVIEFYTPVIEWLQGYAKASNPKTVFIFKLDYFNTASSKMILELLKALKDINGAQVEWYYQEDDEDILDAGKEFSEQVNIPFDFKTMA
jgi:hypothetical protein